jgi:hypothetical protein
MYDNNKCNDIADDIDNMTSINGVGDMLAGSDSIHDPNEGINSKILIGYDFILFP